MSEDTFRVGIQDSDTPELQPRIDLLEPPTRDELAGKSALQALEESLSADPEAVELVRVRVPRRRGVTLLFDSSKVDATKRKAWRKRSTKARPGRDAEVDDFLFSCLVLANTHVSTQMHDEDALDENGSPLTFAHAQLWKMVGAHDPQECIEKLFKNDQHVTVASGDVLLASGIDDDLAAADPTRG